MQENEPSSKKKDDWKKKASHRTGKQNAHPGGWKNP